MTMKTLCVFFLSVSLLGQAPQPPRPKSPPRPEGRIVADSPTNLTVSADAFSMTATAGTLSCGITLTTANAKVECTDSSGNTTSSQVVNLPIPFASQGDIAYGQNSIVWIFVPTSNPNATSLCPNPVPFKGHCWQVAANDTLKTGTW